MHPPRGTEDHRLKGFWSRWVPALAYMALIFSLSSIPDLSPPIDIGNADKLAHFLEYAGLGLLLARAWWGSRWGRDVILIALLTVLSGGVVAAMDETYQGNVTGRERSLADMGADLAGLALAAGTVAVLAARRREREDREHERS